MFHVIWNTFRSTSTSGLILLMATTAFFSETIYGVFYFLDYYVYYDKVFDKFV